MDFYVRLCAIFSVCTLSPIIHLNLKWSLFFFSQLRCNQHAKCFKVDLTRGSVRCGQLIVIFFLVGHCPDVKYKLYPGAFNLKYTMYHFNKNQVP